MKHSRFFYVKSSGNQQMRLSSTQIEMQCHQINLMDSIKNSNNKKKHPAWLMCRGYKQVFFFFLLDLSIFFFAFFNRHFWLLYCTWRFEWSRWKLWAAGASAEPRSVMGVDPSVSPLISSSFKQDVLVGDQSQNRGFGAGPSRERIITRPSMYACMCADDCRRDDSPGTGAGAGLLLTHRGALAAPLH